MRLDFKTYFPHLKVHCSNLLSYTFVGLCTFINIKHFRRLLNERSEYENIPIERGWPDEGCFARFWK